MFDALGFVVFVVVAWSSIGVALSVAMGRCGHSRFGWFVLGSVLGPLAVVLALDALRRLAGRNPGRGPQLEILHGHPATALARCATEGGYQLVAVGTRGTGITKAILGSAASELARASRVPVLLVGGRPVGAPDTADFAVAAS